MSDFTPRTDASNHNAGTDRGRQEIAASLEMYGAARAVVTTKDGEVVAGRHALEEALAQGIELEPVHVDGKKLVVVVRDDWSADSPEAKGYAYADNATTIHNFQMDPQVLAADIDAGLDLERFFSDYELGDLQDDLADPLLTDAQEFEGDYARHDQAERLQAEGRELPGADDAPTPLQQVVLLLEPADHDAFLSNIRILNVRYGTGGVTMTVLEAVRREAER